MMLTLGRGLERMPLLMTNSTLGSGCEGAWSDQGSEGTIAGGKAIDIKYM